MHIANEVKLSALKSKTGENTSHSEIENAKSVQLMAKMPLVLSVDDFLSDNFNLHLNVACRIELQLARTMRNGSESDKDCIMCDC